MQMYYPNIEELSLRVNKSIVFATQGGCIPVPFVREDRHRECLGFVDDVMAYASRPTVKTVVIAAQWYAYFDQGSTYHIVDDENSRQLELAETGGRSVALRSFESLLRKLNEMGKKTYVVLNIPVGDKLNPQSMIHRGLTRDSTFFSIEYGIVSSADLLKYQSIEASIIEVVRRFNAIIVDPKLHLCSNGKCSSITEVGEPIYKDSSHLRPSFVRTGIHFLDETVN
jgi:hypothetical protein